MIYITKKLKIPELVYLTYLIFLRPKYKLAVVRRTFLILFLSIPCYINAQGLSQMAIHADAKVYVYPNSRINIFSNVIQRGTLTSYHTSLINFFAQVWQNEAKSRMPDESPRGIDGVGGIFRFSGQFRNAQRIISVGSQPYNGFPNLSIDNPLNVIAETDNLHINNNLDFADGNLILKGVDVSVGRDSTGTITGYGPTNFIVTGSGMTGGSLKRGLNGRGIKSTDFPIGTSTDSYTPASILYKGIPQNFKLRVADGVYNKMNFHEYVQKTWIIVRDYPDSTGTTSLTLQHNSADEGVEYFRNQIESYISRYDPNLVGMYDIVAPQQPSTPGSITNRTSAFGAYMNTRLNIRDLQTTEYFAKSVIKKQIDKNTPVNIPDAISPNGDGLNDVYIVEKRLPTDKVRFEVFSRNQVLLYQNLDYDNTFDGTGNRGGFLGDVIPDGIYYYLISVNGAKSIPGYLVLNR